MWTSRSTPNVSARDSHSCLSPPWGLALRPQRANALSVPLRAEILVCMLISQLISVPRSVISIRTKLGPREAAQRGAAAPLVALLNPSLGLLAVLAAAKSGRIVV